MSGIICMVCKQEIINQAFRFDDDLGGFVHLKCKPVEEVVDYVIEKNKIRKAVKRMKNPVHFLEKRLK